MIVKKVKNPKASSSKAERIGKLTDYIVDPHDLKCIFSGARGFICNDHQSQKSEMLALSQEAVRSQDTINHYVLSWREGEQPNPDQVEQSVSIFLEELGVKDHQIIYGLHSDTDNIHLHIVINRVHPETMKVVKINKGFDIEVAHKAIARIEHVQGWQRERNGRYLVLENGAVGRELVDKVKPRQPSQSKRDMENRTGEKSAERIAIEVGAPIMKKAQNWEQLHDELAAQGMRYEKTGSGATVFVGDVGIKASSADRDASLGKMQKRLGVYQQPSQKQEVAQRPSEPIQPNVPGWTVYIAGRQSHYAKKAAAKLALDKQQEQERKQLAELQKLQRDQLLKDDWKGRGELLNAMRSVVAAEQAVEKAAMKDRQHSALKQYRVQFRPYPDLEQWQRQHQYPELAEQWRHRASESQLIVGDCSAPPTVRDIRDYVAEVHEQHVYYTRKDAAGGEGVSCFVDTGKHIEIHDWRDVETTLAAMQLAAQKWGSFAVNGSEEYKAMCIKLTAEHRFKISNPELQNSIQQAHQQIQNDKVQATKSEPLRQFERYADAVGAARYRVTSIKMRADGSKQTFILDKKEGVTRGFTPQEIAQRAAEMQRLQKRGENLYYTPLSDDKHHILIDDMTRGNLERLVQDGFTPAVVIESSAGNFQAIITVQKLGTPYDNDVGNRLAERLNREYGDAKLSGCIHPHRAPGYENRKPKHQRPDGSYPDVRLLKAVRRECVKTLAISSQIDAEYQTAALRQPDRTAKSVAPALEVVTASGSVIDAYQLHFRDVVKRQKGGEVDLSRVDSMIAVRLRVTGHDVGDIEEAIRQCAPVTRPTNESRNWSDYAQRTARFAFSASGDRQAQDLGKYRAQWEKLEGRPVLQEIEEGNSPSM